MAKGRRLSIRTTGAAAGATRGPSALPLGGAALGLLAGLVALLAPPEGEIHVRLAQVELLETILELPPDQALVNVSATGEVRLDGRSVTLAELTKRVGAAMARQAPDERVVFVRPDDDAGYGQFVAVLDHIKEGGAVVAVLTEAP